MSTRSAGYRPAALAFTGAVALLFAGCAAEAPKQPDAPKPVQVTPPPPPPPPVPKVPSHLVAPVRPVTETLHGTAVTDPYRYFEDLKNPEVAAHMKAQDAYGRSVIEKIPGRLKMLQRVSELSEAGVYIGGVQIVAGKVFYYKMAPGDSVKKVYVREGFQGLERLLIDPAKVGPAEQKLTLDSFKASPDGKHVAYTVSSRGSEDSMLRVLETGKGNDLGVVIEGTRYGHAISWYPDGRSFFYNKLPPKEEGKPAGYLNSKAYRHVMGKNPANDAPLFGIGVGKIEGLIDIDIPMIWVPQGSNTALAMVMRGDQHDIAIYSAPASTLIGSATPWKKIVDYSDQVIQIAAYGQDLFLLTHKGAINRKVLRTSLVSPELSSARVVVPESDKVVSEIALAGDALYIKQLVGGVDSLQRLNFKSESFGNRLEFLRTKFDMSVRAMHVDPTKPGAVLRMEGWTETPGYYTLEAKSGDIKDTGLLPKSPVNFDKYDEVRLFARAKDGQRIPISMIYKKELLLSRDHPTLLQGYGAYGYTLAPWFSPSRMAWLERGGIVAICHTRGGGEYGEMWHRGGQKANKNNTINDFIACAEFLIERGFTNPKRLAAMGGSAGGITVANALVRRPDLFTAVVSRVGLLDMLRFETTPNGKPNVVEFGTVSKPEDFKWLYETSAYHNVKDGTPYPAVLVATGANDPRVEPWMSLKFAARLQAATSSDWEREPVLMRVDYATGHSSSLTRASANEELADIYSFLLWQMGVEGFIPPPPPPAAAK
jgi:prolyl oligopeptidase